MSFNDIPVPPGRGFRDKANDKKCSIAPKPEFPCYPTGLKANGLILHALLGRVTSNNGTVHEIETMYDEDNQYLEIDVPDCYLDMLENISLGPNLCRYMRWLVCIGIGEIANNLVWLDMVEMTELIPGKRYQTPDPFFEDTLAVFRNGKKVQKSDCDGFTIIDDTTFELNNTYPDTERFSVAYMKKAVIETDPEPPECYT